MRKALVFAAACLVGAAAAHSPGEEIGAERVRVEVGKDGCGFIDSIRFGGRQVVKAPAGFVGGAVALGRAGEGTIDSLFAHAAAAVLPAVVEAVEVDKGAIAVRGAYADGKLRVGFVRRIWLADDGNAIHVSEDADFTALGGAQLVAKHELRLPLVVCEDEHLRMFGFGAAGQGPPNAIRGVWGPQAELFRMDMNDVNRGGKQLISAPRGHWPYWDLGGVVQLPGSHRIWRANHADTLAYPTCEGAGAPGWADYSEADWGITALVDDADAAAPWAITIDARRGVFTIAPRPGDQAPLSAAALGHRKFAFRLVLHKTSWPAAHPCELPPDLYKALLLDMTDGGKAPYVLYWPVGTADPDAIVHRLRVQPSTMLRTLYREDAWRMQGRMKTIGVETPRNQALSQWEQAARQYLEHIRRHGLPKGK